MYVSREDSNETTLVHSLLIIFNGHLCSILNVCEQGRFWQDYTCAQSPLNLHWSLMLHIVCMWAGKILTRLHLCTVSSEPSLVTYAQYFCVCEQRRFWPDYTCAQSPLNLRWSLMLHIVCMWTKKILTRLHLCTVSSDPSLVTYAQYICVCEQRRFCKATLVHSLLFIFAGHLCSILYVFRAGAILTRLHLCRVSSEFSLVTYAQFFFVYEQSSFWRDYTCAQSPLSLRWSLMLNIVCMWAE